MAIIDGHNLVTREDCDKNIRLMLDEIKDIKKSTDDIKLSIAKLPEDIWDKGDKRYANKKTEKTVDKLIWLVLSAVVIAVLSLIINS